MSAAEKFFFFRGKMSVKFFIFTIVVADWFSGALAITNGGNGNKSESKLKREDNRRTFNDYQTDLKPFHTSSSKEESSRSSRYRQPPGDTRNKDRNNNKDRERDSVAANSAYYDKGYGLYVPAEDAVAGYGYQDFDQSPHYGPPIPDRGSGESYGGGGYGGGHGGGGGGYHHQTYDGHQDYHEYHDHREHGLQPVYHHVQYHQPHEHHGSALKGILLPLAGVALLGVAASLVTHPVLLQLGVISGRKKRSLAQDIFKADQSSTIETFTQLKKPFKTFGYEKPAKYVTSEMKAKKNTQTEVKKHANKKEIPKKVVGLNLRKPRVYFFTKRPTTEDLRPIRKTQKTEKEGHFRNGDIIHNLKHFRKKRSTDLIKESNRTVVEVTTKMNISQIAQTPKKVEKKLLVVEKNDSFLDTDDYDDVKHDVNIFHSYGNGKPSTSSSVDFYDSS